ncbi:histidine phosphatase family protein [Paenibacillus athensensis]|uniref:Histidine phosphatase family protein n=1 Tax=Paenibacillus athensensis TaxID=1967502 RepID=A0A4Y8Q8R6_9BACL|nr:histidine phosphatase family protein [Paenibacillus athensensis]MCD1260246.1 histidine phosphatase family protein [Paenibacillus athensensis]
MTTIGLIRHGSTVWNQQGKLQGQLDTELADEGREQARRLGVRLRGEAWSGILASDLKRARETAEIISRESGIPLLGTDARLRERSFGDAEGTTLAERLERWGDDWRKKAQATGGEDDAAVWSRWLDFLTDLTAEAPAKRVLVVSHGGFIVQVLRGWKLEREDFLRNASLTIVQRKAEQWQVELYNCLTHLQEV